MSNSLIKKVRSTWLLLRGYMRSYSSIYGQVLKVIAVLSIFLLIAFGTIFRTINKEYMEDIIQQSGNNVCLFVEGALHQHMLEYNRTALRTTLDLIYKMPGIEDVNMYDDNDRLAYSSFPDDSLEFHNPNCIDCHGDINLMFPRESKSFKIINVDSNCEMSEKEYNHRLLLIKSPILNEPSCYTASCHAHKETDKILGSLIIRIPLESLDSNLKKSFTLAATTTLVLLIFLMFFTRSRIKKPLNEIIRASEAVSKGDKSTRLEIRKDQLSDMRLVSIAFNDMLDNIQSASEELQNWSQQLEYKVQKKTRELSEIQTELIHIERIASLGKLSASVAHEINNPLSGVLTYTKLVHKHLRKIDFDSDEKIKVLKYLGVIEEETMRCGDIVKGLLEFSCSDQRDFQPYHLHKILSKAYSLMGHQMKMSGIKFTTDLIAQNDVVNCNRNQIKQACIAILMNASEAIVENGDIEINTSNPDKFSIKMDIIDNGCGISPEDVPKIFEPFFSTKEKTTGKGLGLAIAHGIIKSHNGDIEVDSQVGRGSTISIILPLHRK